ncbi:unnamed protein product [Sphenostylis stenocarpa]|uniref:Uncharacterized protein n=1 Tax=Sphenostylis stenocarpa TaxID=92480 RepID=A0AA86RNT5_9FABA|nr:unnamed protein product [Sphenostylis stenocarpa]
MTQSSPPSLKGTLMHNMTDQEYTTLGTLSGEILQRHFDSIYLHQHSSFNGTVSEDSVFYGRNVPMARILESSTSIGSKVEIGNFSPITYFHWPTLSGIYISRTVVPS